MKKFKSVLLVLIMLISLFLSGCTANTPKGDIPVGAAQGVADSRGEKGDNSENKSAEQMADQSQKDRQTDQQKNSQDSVGAASPSQSTAAKTDSAIPADKPDSGGGQADPDSSNSGKNEILAVPAVTGASTPKANSDSSPDPNLNSESVKTVTISINCQTAVDKGLHLKEKFQEVVPADGVILAPLAVEIKEGETVFAVLKRVVREHKIHMEYEGSKGTPYIQGINNLYEFDGGPLSGWMYCVNKVYPNYGCGEYKLKPGDIIEWNYTCDLGKDLGQTWLGE